MSDMLSRVAGAPITWGADASAGWGYLMDPARVMSEMREAGLSATELGPDGFLPSDPQELKDFVAGYGMSMVGGFVPAILYQDKDMDADVQYFERASDQLAEAGASNVVLGPRSNYDGYDTEIDMDDDQWEVFLRNLRRFQDITEKRGLQTALHPHWGMAISRQNQVDRLLNSCDVGMCVDAGHLFLSGVDPLQVVKDAGDRVLHVHIKDLTNEMAEKVRSGEVPFRQATIDGMFVPAGSGDVDLAGIIRHLEGRGYQGWYVLEQDCSLTGDPAPGTGPIEDAKASVEFLKKVAATL
ncbi:MAG: TIM barrel protein [Candidatus Nanopelagicales bacterium]|nr:TIM barrel protein [Candidatus Nanopelagicales bacterium]